MRDLFEYTVLIFMIGWVREGESAFGANNFEDYLASERKEGGEK